MAAAACSLHALPDTFNYWQHWQATLHHPFSQSMAIQFELAGSIKM